MALFYSRVHGTGGNAAKGRVLPRSDVLVEALREMWRHGKSSAKEAKGWLKHQGKGVAEKAKV